MHASLAAAEPGAADATDPVATADGATPVATAVTAAAEPAALAAPPLLPACCPPAGLVYRVWSRLWSCVSFVRAR